MGPVDPVRDHDVVTGELALADLAVVERRLEKTRKTARAGDKDAQAELVVLERVLAELDAGRGDRKSTRLNSSHSQISYAVFCLKKKKKEPRPLTPCREPTSGHCLQAGPPRATPMRLRAAGRRQASLDRPYEMHDRTCPHPLAVL